jgi:hypothetical protein
LSEAVHVALRQWRIAADASQTEKSHGKVAPKVSMAHSVALLLMAPATSIPCTSRPSKAKQKLSELSNTEIQEAYGSIIEACGSLWKIQKHLEAVAG